MHVNYCEGKGELNSLFKYANKFGYDGVELRWKYAFDDLTQEAYQEKVAKLKNAYPHFEIVFVGCVNFCRGNKEGINTELVKYLDFLSWAKNNCDTKVMNFFTGALVCSASDYWSFHTQGSAIAFEADYDNSANGLQKIGESAAKLGIKIALETHNNYLHDTAKSCKKLMELTNHKAIGINYDHGNIHLHKNGESIAEVFSLLKDKIYYAHLKNMVKPVGLDGYFPTRLADGEINIRNIVEKLKSSSPCPMVTLEYPCSGDTIYAMQKDIEYFKLI